MAILIDIIATLPIEAIILAIIVNELCCHSIYKFAVMFLFEKGMTNRQRREWRKERFFKRRTMRYIRTTIKSFPEQDFSPNIEKYHLLDVIFLAISIIVLAVVSITYYFIREINWVIVVTYQIFEALTVATGIFYCSHRTARDKKGRFVGLFCGECTLK